MRRPIFCIATCAALLLSGQVLHAQTITPAPTHQQWCQEELSANQWQHDAIVASFDKEFARIEAERSAALKPLQDALRKDEQQLQQLLQSNVPNKAQQQQALEAQIAAVKQQIQQVNAQWDNYRDGTEWRKNARLWRVDRAHGNLVKECTVPAPVK